MHSDPRDHDDGGGDGVHDDDGGDVSSVEEDLDSHYKAVHQAVKADYRGDRPASPAYRPQRTHRRNILRLRTLDHRGDRIVDRWEEADLFEWSDC